METKRTIRRFGSDLTEGPIVRTLLAFSIPMVLTNLIQQLYTLVDLIIIGQFVGDTGTVAVSVGGEICDMLTPIATAFATAGQIYIAQLAGSKAMSKMSQTIGTFITMMLLIAIVVMTSALCFRDEIIVLLNCPLEAAQSAGTYLLITAFGLPFIFCYNAICGALRGLGESRWPMLFIIVAAAMNIVLDYMLVAFFSMGVLGTAIATLLSQVTACCAAFTCLITHRSQLNMELKWSLFRIRKDIAYIILSLGIPQAVRSLLVRFSMLWVNSQINAFGLTASATNSIGNKLQSFMEVYTSSISQASAAAVGQNLGAGKQERSKRIITSALKINLLIASIISMLIVLWPEKVFGIFTNDAETLELGIVYLHILICHVYFSGITGSLQAMVIGCGNASLNFIVGILDGFICKIGLSLLLVNVFHMGVMGFFWGISLSRVVPGMMCGVYLFSGRWKHRKLLIDREPKPTEG